MEAALAWINPFLDNGVALFWLLFLLAFANVFVPPVPIETISVGIGYLTVTGHGQVIWLWLALALGMAAGSTLLYYLARSQEHRLLQSRAVSSQITPVRLAKVESWFGHWGIWVIYAGKLIPGMSFATVLACGLFGAPPRKALTAIYLANLLYFAVTVVLGRILGERWYEIFKISKQYWPWLVGIILVLALATGVVWIGRHWRR